MNLLRYFFLLSFFVFEVFCWDSEELEIFDLVEEINDNFYGVLGIQQDATLMEVKKAFRNLSIILHPDKSDAVDADVQFRNLVSIYEVLKDTSKREKYNNVLKNGLPNWKSGLYYYRHFRKMGLMEMFIILFVIITIGQYFVAYAAYVEKKYTAEQIFGSKLKKLQKKNKTNVNIESILNEIPPPSIKNTLPFQIPYAIWNTPKAIKAVYNMYCEYKKDINDRKQLEIDEAAEQKLLQEEFLKEKEAKGARKRKPVVIAEKTEEELKGYSKVIHKSRHVETIMKPVLKNSGLWTDEDLSELIKLVKKYPGGTVDRWELIADALDRNVSEVTMMASKLKENGYRIPGQTDVTLENKKIKTKKENQILLPETTWTQEQQQALEVAIVKYPKSTATDRWQKIAACIPEKTKEECLARYKYLVELVKMQKQSQDTNEVVESSAKTDKLPEKLANKTDDDKLKDESNLISNNESTKKQNQKVVTDEEPVLEVKTKGKPKNKRKERKKQINLSSEEDTDDNE